MWALASAGIANMPTLAVPRPSHLGSLSERTHHSPSLSILTSPTRALLFLWVRRGRPHLELRRGGGPGVPELRHARVAHEAPAAVPRRADVRGGHPRPAGH